MQWGSIAGQATELWVKTLKAQIIHLQNLSNVLNIPPAEFTSDFAKALPSSGFFWNFTPFFSRIAHASYLSGGSKESKICLFLVTRPEMCQIQKTNWSQRFRLEDLNTYVYIWIVTPRNNSSKYHLTDFNCIVSRYAIVCLHGTFCLPSLGTHRHN